MRTDPSIGQLPGSGLISQSNSRGAIHNDVVFVRICGVAPVGQMSRNPPYSVREMRAMIGPMLVPVSGPKQAVK